MALETRQALPMTPDLATHGTARRGRNWLRRGGMAACALAFTLILLGIGLNFFAFVARLERHDSPSPGGADAIVALTGGAERIDEAIDLLAAGRARRLLISGVNAATSPEELRRRLPGRDNLFACCIDLDYRAQNTIGNVLEARRWVDRHHFRSLIVVTSSYHMPRTLLEAGRTLPGVTLVPHVVVAGGADLERWWRDPALAKLLLTEYLKYLAARARPKVESLFGSNPHGTAVAASPG